MMLFGTIASVFVSFVFMILANENYFPNHINFWLSIIALVLGYVFLFKYCQEKDFI